MIAAVFPREGGRGWRRALPHAVILAMLAAGSIMALQAAWIPAKAVLAQLLLERTFAQSLADGTARRPWPWADTKPIARIAVARLGESDIVLSGGSGEAMAFGPTAVLEGDDGRPTLLAGHRDTHFAWIRDLRIGDTLTLTRLDGSRATYRAVRFDTVSWDEFTVPADPHRQLLALATCFPFGSNSSGPLRRVAWAERID